MSARYLLDSHVLLWMGLETGKLSKKARRTIEAPSSELLLSIASVWELSIKKSLGRLRLPVPLRAFIEQVCSEAGVALLPVDFLHAIGVEEIERIHGDPFDRMLISQARHNNLKVISADEIFDKYRVSRVW